MAAPGILLVDKPQGITSHDVVARARRALGTRKIGHAGTVDPMATGLLVLGVEGATRLLTFVVGLDKTYEATIRLGVSTDTDDADGQIVGTVDASSLESSRIAEAIAPLTGRISQVPSTYSAIKVDGRRAYDLARAGEDVQLKAREVTVSRFAVLAERRASTVSATEGVVDVDVVVDCSSGTYIRSLARDLGAALGVGGHLTALRRTRIGPFDVATAVAVDAIADAPLLAPAEAAAAVLGRFDVTAEEARDLRHGKRLTGAASRLPASPTAAVDPAGGLVGIVERRGADVKSAMNMPEEAAR
ncbi:tRNA pseudouridine(55) synthase TruB [Microbacterium jejuense]|uniref:tRNA pseudouridine synthase B n=1 Tax=Microbacterium jejuense TaxID=1263637 RepID=A0ABS7HLX8_9MICO|nr:tRNA pseudouridine(55) synthase TruB [Microbacterium jejuense]MBW9093688.1 tRNA pseudouridine(55) synthase TruB [Microbacterium jejuense]